MMFKWKKYNGAIVSDEPPYMEPTSEDIEYAKKYNDYLFVSYVTDFDCEKETPWWYIIKDTPIEIEKMKSKKRYRINKGLKYVDVKKISCIDYKEELYNCFVSAAEKYDAYNLNTTRENFFKQLNDDAAEYWAAFLKENNEIVGYARNVIHDNCVDFTVMKLNPRYINYEVSAAIVYTIVNEYIKDYNFISDGQRSIRHKTNIQNYLVENFGFRKAYCKLNIIYSEKMKFAVKVLFPFRKIIDIISGNNVMVNNIASVLKMEEIRRECEKI